MTLHEALEAHARVKARRLQQHVAGQVDALRRLGALVQHRLRPQVHQQVDQLFVH